MDDPDERQTGHIRGVDVVVDLVKSLLDTFAAQIEFQARRSAARSDPFSLTLRAIGSLLFGFTLAARSLLQFVQLGAHPQPSDGNFGVSLRKLGDLALGLEGG